MAEKYNTYIAVGYLERKNSDYYNSYLIADKEKVYGIVEKVRGKHTSSKEEISPVL